MMRKAILALAAAAAIIAAAVALFPASHAPTAAFIDTHGDRDSKPCYVKGRMRIEAFEHSVGCALVVW